MRNKTKVCDIIENGTWKWLRVNSKEFMEINSRVDGNPLRGEDKVVFWEVLHQISLGGSKREENKGGLG